MRFETLYVLHKESEVSQELNCLLRSHACVTPRGCSRLLGANSIATPY